MWTLLCIRWNIKSPIFSLWYLVRGAKQFLKVAKRCDSTYSYFPCCIKLFFSPFWEGGGGGRLVSPEPDVNCPCGTALMWLTPFSSLSLPLQLAWWQAHVEETRQSITVLPSLSSLSVHPLHFLSIMFHSLPFRPSPASHLSATWPCSAPHSG